MELQDNQQIIEQIIPLPKKSKDENKAEFQAFRDNFDLIIKHSDFIIKTPELFHITFNFFSIGLAHLGGSHASFGVLLQLWREEILVDKCDACSGKLYIFCAGGSPLSGQNKCSGICQNCKRVSKIKLPSVGPIIKALKHMKNNLNKKKSIRTKGQYFSWKHGLVGKPVPDKVIESGVQPVTVEKLVRRLRQYE